MNNLQRTQTGVFRSLLDTTHTSASAHWEVENDICIVSDYGETELERKQASGRLALLDLSPLPRFGLKGVETRTWLAAHGYSAGDDSNQAYPQSDGCSVARLSPRELLFLCDPAHPVMSVDHDYFTPGRECYMIRRQDTHFWFALTGEKAPPMLAKLCGVNFDPAAFADHQIAQTQVARTSAIVLRLDIHETLCYYLLGDSSYAVFMWACLVDAMQEYEGRILGLRAIRDHGLK